MTKYNNGSFVPANLHVDLVLVECHGEKVVAYRNNIWVDLKPLERMKTVAAAKFLV